MSKIVRSLILDLKLQKNPGPEPDHSEQAIYLSKEDCTTQFSPRIRTVPPDSDYFIAALTFVCVAISLNWTQRSLEQRNMGLIAWTFLFGLLWGENKEVRMQVIIAVAFATLGEHFASIYMQGYTYRFGNVPAYVPPGHGMVYLTAVALARSGFFLTHARKIAMFVVVTCGAWSAGDQCYPRKAIKSVALLFCVFLIYLFKGRSPMVSCRFLHHAWLS